MLTSCRGTLAVLALGCASTVYGQPVISAVLNGASYDAVVSPNCWISIFGSGLATGQATAQSVPLPLALGGVSLTVGGVPAALLYVSARQINALIPAGVTIPATTLVPLVLTSAAGAATYNIRMTPKAPSIFTRNGSGTGRALLFDAGFHDVDIVKGGDTVILYATGLGATDTSGNVIDPIDVYMGERQARILSASLAPGFAGVYQLNVIAPKLATDRVYLRAGGWQSNVATFGIPAGANVASVTGDIDGLYPSTAPFFTLPPCVDESSPDPCGAGETLSVMLNAATFHLNLDLAPTAAPFDVAVVGPGGASVISVAPQSGTYSAVVSTVTTQAARGDFSQSLGTLWDYTSCTPEALCSPFPGPGVVPVSRIDPFWFRATRALAVSTDAQTGTPNAVVQFSGALDGTRLTIDNGTNAGVATFGAIVQMPLGPFETRVSTFSLYVDGRMMASKDIPYRVAHR